MACDVSESPSPFDFCLQSFWLLGRVEDDDGRRMAVTVVVNTTEDHHHRILFVKKFVIFRV